MFHKLASFLLKLNASKHFSRTKRRIKHEENRKVKEKPVFWIEYKKRKVYFTHHKYKIQERLKLFQFSSCSVLYFYFYYNFLEWHHLWKLKYVAHTTTQHTHKKNQFPSINVQKEFWRRLPRQSPNDVDTDPRLLIFDKVSDVGNLTNYVKCYSQKVVKSLINFSFSTKKSNERV